jgi:nucleoside phosphorylase
VGIHALNRDGVIADPDTPLATLNFPQEFSNQVLSGSVIDILTRFYNRVVDLKDEFVVTSLLVKRVVIISALHEENTAVTTMLEKTYEASKHVEIVSKKTNRILREWRVKDKHGAHLLIWNIEINTMGSISAAQITAPLLEEFKPHFVIMPGVCGGRETKVNIGDVVVADRVYFLEGKHKSQTLELDLKTISVDTYLLNDFKQVDYDAARSRVPEGLLRESTRLTREKVLKLVWGEDSTPSSEGVEGSTLRSLSGLDLAEYKAVTRYLENDSQLVFREGRYYLSESAKQYISDQIARGYDFPEADFSLSKDLHVGAVAVSSFVEEDMVNLWPTLTGAVRNTLAVEMEGYGVFQAVREYNTHNPKPHCSVILVKGVMDLGNHQKNDFYKNYVAHTSAAWAVEFLHSFASRIAVK